MRDLQGLLLRKDHIFLSISSKIAEICHPLLNLNIHHFCYLKKYDDNSEIYLSNQEKWVSDYYRLALYNSSYYANFPEQYLEKLSFWWKDSDSLVMQYGQKHFNNDLGLTYCISNDTNKEFFFFAFQKKYHYL